MGMNFEATMTEGDFKQPLLDPAEEKIARETRGGVDLEVDGLFDSVLSRILRAISGGSANKG